MRVTGVNIKRKSKLLISPPFFFNLPSLFFFFFFLYFLFPFRTLPLLDLFRIFSGHPTLFCVLSCSFLVMVCDVQDCGFRDGGATTTSTVRCLYRRAF